MFKNIITFLLGALTGSAVTYVVVNKKANERADREVEEMKHYYDIKFSKKCYHEEEPAEEEEIPYTSEEREADFNEAAKMIVDLGYAKADDIPMYTDWVNEDAGPINIYEIEDAEYNSHYDADTREEEYNVYRNCTRSSDDEFIVGDLADAIGNALRDEILDLSTTIPDGVNTQKFFYDEDNNILITTNIFGMEWDD